MYIHESLAESQLFNRHARMFLSGIQIDDRQVPFMGRWIPATLRRRAEMTNPAELSGLYLDRRPAGALAVLTYRRQEHIF